MSAAVAARTPKLLLGMMVCFAAAESLWVYYYQNKGEAMQFILRIAWCMLAVLSLGSNDDFFEFPRAAVLGTLDWVFTVTDLAYIFTLPSIALWVSMIAMSLAFLKMSNGDGPSIRKCANFAATAGILAAQFSAEYKWISILFLVFSNLHL